MRRAGEPTQGTQTWALWQTREDVLSTQTITRAIQKARTCQPARADQVVRIDRSLSERVVRSEDRLEHAGALLGRPRFVRKRTGRVVGLELVQFVDTLAAEQRGDLLAVDNGSDVNVRLVALGDTDAG